MSYLEEFKRLLENQQFSKFFPLWEEYCLSEEVDGDELLEILRKIKNSDLTKPFGQIAETVLPLWQRIEDPKVKDEVLRLVMDLQTTNTAQLADYALEYLKLHFPHDEYFNEKLKIVGLRSRQNFQGALSNFELLSHMKRGHFVFHTGGWGVGEVMEISLLREHVILEFEGITALKDISFENAFKNLIPLPSDHFLARRFGNPDFLEKEGKQDPAELIRLLLRDLGPKTAAEIKDELCDLVIPEKDWTKWWQSARGKIKKDTLIKTPNSLQEPFSLRKKELSHENRFLDILKGVKTLDNLILTIYNFTRDFAEISKDEEARKAIKFRLEDAKKMIDPNLSQEEKDAKEMQIHFLLEDIFPKDQNHSFEKIISMNNVEGILEKIDIVSFKKKVLMIIREKREDWIPIFLALLFKISQNTLRDYLFKELSSDETSKALLQAKLTDLLNKVSLYPEAFLWYFQKINGEEEDVPFSDSEHKKQFLEAFMILFHYVETKPELRDFVKKMYLMLTAKRYFLVREIIKEADLDFLNEFLLLASKCQSLNNNDMRILHSLAEVVHPSLGKMKKEKQEDKDIIWITSEGYQKLREKINHIGTVEIVDNAKEIEAARALGDLRENAEYKFALERRSRLQAELKNLMKQLQMVRILRPEDISQNEVGIGAVVELVDSQKNKITYTLLGPWEANPNQNILSFQSKLAQAMMGFKTGDNFTFQGEEFTVNEIKSYL